MSKVAKGVGKVFKKAVKVVKKIAKPLLIAAAVYFTAGLALSAFPATASFAASLPGFAGGGLAGTGIAAGGSTATAGTGIFSKVAAKMGLATLGKGGGLVGGALGSAGHLGVQAATTASLANAGISQAAISAGTTKALTAGKLIPTPVSAKVANVMGSELATGVTNAATGASAGTYATAAGTSAVAPTVGGVAAGGTLSKLSFGDKLLLAKMGSDVISGYLAPDPKELIEEQKKWQGAFYGVTPETAPAALAARQSSGAPMMTPQAKPAPAQAKPMVTQAPPMGSAPQSMAPAGGSLIPQIDGIQQPTERKLPDLQPDPTADEDSVERDLFSIRAPGVRYV